MKRYNEYRHGVACMIGMVGMSIVVGAGAQTPAAIEGKAHLTQRLSPALVQAPAAGALTLAAQPGSFHAGQALRP